ncbi:hypothetical protein L665_00206 [Ralstonia solanacearum SD54]|nr:hypothetical protein L665_00206 [Ralstonia solanacearum SD54]
MPRAMHSDAARSAACRLVAFSLAIKVLSGVAMAARAPISQ